MKLSEALHWNAAGCREDVVITDEAFADELFHSQTCSFLLAICEAFVEAFSFGDPSEVFPYTAAWNTDCLIWNSNQRLHKRTQFLLHLFRQLLCRSNNTGRWDLSDSFKNALPLHPLLQPIRAPNCNREKKCLTASCKAIKLVQASSSSSKVAPLRPNGECFDLLQQCFQSLMQWLHSL